MNQLLHRKLLQLPSSRRDVLRGVGENHSDVKLGLIRIKVITSERRGRLKETFSFEHESHQE